MSSRAKSSEKRTEACKRKAPRSGAFREAGYAALGSAARAITGYHVSSSLFVGLLCLGGALSIAACKLNKALTLQMAAELADRRAKATAA